MIINQRNDTIRKAIAVDRAPMKYKTIFMISLLILFSSFSSHPQMIENQPVNAAVVAQNSTPAARYLPAFVFDPINERVMMYGGGSSAGGDVEYEDTWTFDYMTRTWTELTVDTTPGPRHSAVMVYDTTDEVIILFGGSQGISRASDTWIFNCSTEEWTEVTPAVSPPGRMSHAMVYDSANERVLLFSGYGPSGPNTADTWAYDYSTNIWQEMSPETSPHARYGASYIYDDVNETMIIFGGNSNGYFSDTWSYAYDTDIWTNLYPITHPQALKWSSSVYDSANQKMILFGGDDALSRSVNDTWVFDSQTNEWEEREPALAPPAREAFGFAFDTDNEKAILFGGIQLYNDQLVDTWAYDFQSNTWEEMIQISDSTPLLVAVIVIPVIAVVIVIAYSFMKKRR